jgi:DNA polymerase III delta subunit
MKTIALHGENTEKLYQRLTQFIGAAKKRDWEIIYDQVPNTPSLFGNERLVIYRDISKITKQDLRYIEKLEGTIVFYHEGTMSPTFLKSLPANSKVEEFKLPKLIWTFLEHIYPGNAGQVVREFHKIIEKDTPEFIFSQIARQFRDLYWVKTDSKSTNFPLWKVRKLESQSKRYSLEKLIKLINLLAELDVEVKTSKADLVSSLDLIFIKHLE